MARPSDRILISAGVVIAALAAFTTAVVTQQAPNVPATTIPPVGGRGSIQSAGGGRGPGAAPEADNPLNAGADLSPKPPVVALTPQVQATKFWLPPGYKMEPILWDPVVENPAEIRF